MDGWIQRAIQFFEKLKSHKPWSISNVDFTPPVTEREISENSTSYKWPIPDPLVQFYYTEASQCHLEYSLCVPDVDSCFWIVPYTEIKGGFEMCEQWGNSISEDSKDAGDMWLNAVPFIHITCGDIIAFDMRVPTKNPPIVYLDHEGLSHPPIAASFAEFLFQWERICYVGPDMPAFADYINKKTGFLDYTLPAAAVLRSQLQSPFV